MSYRTAHVPAERPGIKSYPKVRDSDAQTRGAAALPWPPTAEPMSGVSERLRAIGLEPAKMTIREELLELGDARTKARGRRDVLLAAVAVQRPARLARRRAPASSAWRASCCSSKPLTARRAG